MLKGRLGLETARIPQRDRHGLVWLEHGQLAVRAGTLIFTTAGGAGLEPGEYDLPYQMINALLLGPGTSVSHDSLRLMARHGTGFVAVGSDGVRSYATSLPAGPDRSKLARHHARLWADPDRRTAVSRAMFSRRFGDDVAGLSLNQLRGAEAARVKKAYRNVAARHGIQWTGRQYDRHNPAASNDVNEALNHSTVALLAAAKTSVAIVGAVPQLGFIHEDSGWAFSLDIADLHRETIALEGAFAAVSFYRKRGGELERIARRETGKRIRECGLVGRMIDDIKDLLNDRGGDE